MHSKFLTTTTMGLYHMVYTFTMLYQTINDHFTDLIPETICFTLVIMQLPPPEESHIVGPEL